MQETGSSHACAVDEVAECVISVVRTVEAALINVACRFLPARLLGVGYDAYNFSWLQQGYVKNL